ncbi:MAG: hypothetical protein CL949_14450 [Erythrobacter sp.]|nr:hypothetical protein [Erythrobacter sp.]|tara:strand:+ start:1242 stop:1475 length:234 start_codon:yes stop_codon:yes gene_type:complete
MSAVSLGGNFPKIMCGCAFLNAPLEFDYKGTRRRVIAKTRSRRALVLMWMQFQTDPISGARSTAGFLAQVIAGDGGG